MRMDLLSLVVAEATDAGPRIVSDTRVVFPEGPRSSFKTGTLKTVIITRDVTICFAGDVIAGLNGVRGFAKELRGGGPVDDLLLRLQELTSDDQRVVEFIVATGKSTSQLTRIRNGGVERSLGSAWIGDQEGFERFQRARHTPLDHVSAMESTLPPATRVMARLRRAMQTVIDEPAIDSVGDFCVAVAYKPTGFEYLESTFIHVGRDIRVQPGEDLISKMAQSVEEGGYTVSVVEPLEPGTAALGLNFPMARLGMLYLPLEFDGGQFISDVSAHDFAKAVLERFGIAMKNPMLRHG